MSSNNYVKARGGPNNITIYYTEDNRLMIRSGGKWTWRNNNPGNMRYGNYSKSNGCIGYSGGFAQRGLNQNQFEILVKAIKQFEGWEVGHTNLPLRITKVLKHPKKKIIVAYYIENMGWVKKERAITLSINYKIDGVVVNSRTGSIYIRTRNDVKITNNLGVLG